MRYGTYRTPVARFAPESTELTELTSPIVSAAIEKNIKNNDSATKKLFLFEPLFGKYVAKREKEYIAIRTNKYENRANHNTASSLWVLSIRKLLTAHRLKKKEIRKKNLFD